MAALLLASAGLASCGPAERAGVAVDDLASPAGPDSGEPFLSTRGDTLLLSWLQATGTGGHALHLARGVGDRWTEPTEVTVRDDLFVNWADFPSVVAGPDGTLWAHWLQRGPAGGYDYGVRVVASRDGGRSWSEPFTPHEDGTPQEHGFVTFLPDREGAGIVWLDGRGYEGGTEDAPHHGQMALRHRRLSLEPDGSVGPAGPEEVVDARTCDCCQTAAGATADGALVAYRDRSDEEIRDILVVRRTPEGWSEPRPVARDGWEIDACPVNGPALAARNDQAVVAWFTAAQGRPRVRIARSGDGGATFGEPVEVDDGNPAGRVDVLLLDDGAALVSWVERLGGEAAELRMRRVEEDGTASASWTVVAATAARSSGFPRMAALSDGRVVVAWTHVTAEGDTDVRLSRVSLP